MLEHAVGYRRTTSRYNVSSSEFIFGRIEHVEEPLPQGEGKMKNGRGSAFFE